MSGLSCRLRLCCAARELPSSQTSHHLIPNHIFPPATMREVISINGELPPRYRHASSPHRASVLRAVLTHHSSRPGRLPDRQLLLGGMYFSCSGSSCETASLTPFLYSCTASSTVSRYTRTPLLTTPPRPILTDASQLPARWLPHRGAQAAGPRSGLQHFLLRDWYGFDLVPDGLGAPHLTAPISRSGQVRPPYHLLRSRAQRYR